MPLQFYKFLLIFDSIQLKNYCSQKQKCPQFSRKTFERLQHKINFSVKNALFSTKSYNRGTRFLVLDFTFKDVTRLKKVISLSNFTAVPRVCTIVQTIPLNQDLTRYCLDLWWKSFLGRCLESYIERFISTYTKVKTTCKVSRGKRIIPISIIANIQVT